MWARPVVGAAQDLDFEDFLSEDINEITNLSANLMAVSARPMPMPCRRCGLCLGLKGSLLPQQSALIPRFLPILDGLWMFPPGGRAWR